MHKVVILLFFTAFISIHTYAESNFCAEWTEENTPNAFAQNEFENKVIKLSERQDISYYLDRWRNHTRKNNLNTDYTNEQQIAEALNTGKDVEAKRVLEMFDLMNNRKLKIPEDMLEHGLSFAKNQEQRQELIDTFSINNISYNEQTEKEKCGEAKNHASTLGPVRDQGRDGWCQSYTLADLIHHKTGKNVSPIHLGLNVFSDMDALDRENTRYGIAIKGGAIFGRYENYRRWRDGEETYRESMATERNIQGLTEDFGLADVVNKFNIIKNRNICLENQFPSNNTNVTELLCTLRDMNFENRDTYQDYVCNYSKMFQPLGNNQIDTLQAIQDANQGIAEEQLIDLVSSPCTEGSLQPQEMSNIEAKRTPFNMKTDEKIDVINRLLDDNRIASVHYKASIFGSPFADNSSGHLSSVVGKRWNEEIKQCQYLIRNSWGADWNPNFENSEVQRAPNHSGHAWVSKSALGRVLTNVQYLE